MLGFVLIFPILFLQRRGGLHFRGRGDRFHYEICRLGVAFESRYVVEDFLLTWAVSVSEALTFLQFEGLTVTAGEEITFCFVCISCVLCLVSFVYCQLLSKVWMVLSLCCCREEIARKGVPLSSRKNG